MNLSMSFIRSSLFVFFSGLFLVTMTGCQKQLGPYLEKAQKSFTEKNYVDTIDALNSGLSHWQESEGPDTKAEAYELLGKSHRALRNAEKALDAYNQSAKISQNRFDVYFDMASIYLTKGFADQAERNFREALRVKPDDALALLGLGNSLYAQRKLNEAAEAFERIMETSPGVKDALESLAAMRKTVHKAVHKPVARSTKASIKKTSQKKPAAKKNQSGKRR